jgi:glycerate-2-kinase
MAALEASLRRVMRRRLLESGARVGFSFIGIIFITIALKTEGGRAMVGPMGTFEKAMEITRAGLAAVEGGRLVRESLVRSGRDLTIRGKRFDLGRFERVFLIAAGKAAGPMAAGFMAVLGDKVDEGIVTCRPGENPAPDRLTAVPAAHPLPDAESVRAGREAVRLAGKAGENDAVFLLVSGGASATLCLPAPGVRLEDKRFVTERLLKAGADIRELNAVRKHLSSVKGGLLARAAWPATVISLVISDVIGNDLEVIASGPAHRDSSTFGDAGGVLRKFGLWEVVPAPVRDRLSAGGRGEADETLKEGDRALTRISTFVIGDIGTALRAAQAKARELGFDALILTDSDSGEAGTAAKNYAAFLEGLFCSRKAPGIPLCFLAGGEVTVTVKGKGLGGRNTEFVLAALVAMPRSARGWLILSFGTDGRDGPTDAAGAWADPSLWSAARAERLDPRTFLAENDSYSFFKRTGRLIVTGPTATNVMDLRVFIMN